VLSELFSEAIKAVEALKSVSVSALQDELSADR
jgi:hypothetical protein